MKNQVGLMIEVAACACAMISRGDDFVPVFRFAACSDTHISSTGAVQAQRLAKLFESAYRYARGQDYNTIDALIMVGDLTNGGGENELKALNQTIEENIRPETTLIRVMGNHEFNAAGIENWKRLVDSELDKSVVVKGFHFIGMSPIGRSDQFADRAEWLEGELAKAAADDPERPIFTFQHHHIRNTVYVSRSWHTPDSAALDAVYKKFPQVFNFSGHSHGPINNPLSIWQDGYTLLGTGTLSYFEMERGMSGGTIPPNAGNAAQYYILEVDAKNRVRVLPYNILTDDFFKTASNTDDPARQLVWSIDKPSDPSTFTYTEARGEQSKAPHFAKDASAKIEALTDTKAKFSFPQALADADDCVYGYRAVLHDGESTRVVKFFSEYYFEPMPEMMSHTFSSLRPGQEYSAEIFPINEWGKEGEPLTFAFRTEDYGGRPYDSENPVTFEGTFSDFESVRELRRSPENGVYSGNVTGDYFAGEWSGSQSKENTIVELAEGKGYNGSTALAIRLDSDKAENRGIYLFATEGNKNPKFFGDAQYLRVWVDFTGVDFRKMCFGLVDQDGELYSTDDIDGRKDLFFYYRPEGSTTWQAFTHGDDGCFGAAQGSSVKDFRGWLAFPIKDFGSRKHKGEVFAGSGISGVYVFWDYAGNDLCGHPFYLDEIAVVPNYATFTPMK